MTGVPLVVAVVGRDRTGIVGDLARVIAQAGGNWEESTLLHLAGRFAGVVQITAPDEAAAARIEAGLGACEGVRILVDRGDDVIPEGASIRLAITADDRPGIVRDVTRVLVDRRANIVAFNTRTVEAPMAGGVLFEAELEARVAPDDVDALRSALEALQQDLQVDLET